MWNDRLGGLYIYEQLIGDIMEQRIEIIYHGKCPQCGREQSERRAERVDVISFCPHKYTFQECNDIDKCEFYNLHMGLII